MPGNLMHFYEQLWNPLLYALVDMEGQGITLDCAQLERKAVLALERAAEIKAILDEWAEYYIRQVGEFNWGSTQQLANFLYNFKCYPIPPIMGTLNSVKANREKKPTTSEAAIDWLAKNTKSGVDREMLNLLTEMNKCIKLAQFMTKLPTLVDSDGRLRCQLRPGTDTGRLNSSAPNLQNIPIRNDRFHMREAFIAAQGHKLVVADYSQLEMYVMAHFLIYELQDYSLYEDLTNGDVHTNTAFRLWGPELEKLGATRENIKEVAKRYRDNAKTVNYAIPYGKTAKGLGYQIVGADGLSIGTKAAQDVLDAYFSAYPGLHELFEKWRSEAREEELVRTLLGRDRPLPGVNSSNKWERFAAERRVVNTRVQGSAADIVSAALLKVSTSELVPERYRNTNLKGNLILQVHDELIVETAEEHAQESLEIVKHTMENPLDMPLAVQLEVDAQIGNSWGECK